MRIQLIICVYVNWHKEIKIQRTGREGARWQRSQHFLTSCFLSPVQFSRLTQFLCFSLQPALLCSNAIVFSSGCLWRLYFLKECCDAAKQSCQIVLGLILRGWLLLPLFAELTAFKPSPPAVRMRLAQTGIHWRMYNIRERIPMYFFFG